jgi:hypothetical protein
VRQPLARHHLKISREDDMKSRMLTILVTVLVTASLLVLEGPTRSATPVLGAGADKIAINAAVTQLINST